MSKPTRLVSAALAVLCPLAAAQGPDPALLPADTSFVAHFDLRGLAELIGVDDLLREVGEDDAREVSAVLRRMERDWGFDPLRDILALTVFGRRLPRDEPRVMFVTSARIDGVVAALSDEGALRPERRGELLFHRIHPARVAAALGFSRVDVDEDPAVLYVHELRDGRRAILVGERVADLEDAARVLAGEAPSLEGARRPGLELRPSRGSLAFLEVSASLEELTRRTPASELASKVRWLAMELSEDQGTVDFRLVVVTTSPRHAADAAAVINGLRGLISLANLGDEMPGAVRRALTEARAEADGDRVTVRLSAPLSELRGLLEQKARERSRRDRDPEPGERDERDRDRRRREVR